MKPYLFGFALVSTLLSACSIVSYDLHPQSHYDYPNSNIKPLGEAVGKASVTSFLIPPTGSSAEQERQAVAEALKTKPGADLLVNYISETKTTSIMNLITIVDYTVHGTAASMLIDKQTLR